LCYQQCPKNSFKRLYIVKKLLFLVEKASFSIKNFGRNFNAVERVISSENTLNNKEHPELEHLREKRFHGLFSKKKPFQSDS